MAKRAARFRTLGIAWMLAAAAVHGATAAPPRIEVRAWALADFDTGNVLAEHDADAEIAPASLTKLVTAYLLFDALKAGRLQLDDDVTIGRNAWNVPGSRMFLRPGDRATVEELLLGMIVRSANDATLALVEQVAGDEQTFVTRMNALARTLDLRDSNFANSTGLDAPGQRSSVRDLTRVARALIRDFPEYYRWFGIKEFSYRDIEHHNRNALLWRDASIDGVKTGRTRAAGYCLIVSARRGDMRLIATIVGAPGENARLKAGRQLIEYGFQNFETRLLYAAGVPAANVRVWMGRSSALPLGVDKDLFVTLPRGTHTSLSARLTVKDAPIAPIEYGQVVGSLELEFNQQPLARFPLLALKRIESGNILQRTIDRIELWIESNRNASFLE
jgi:D-alanyl-D-alanine carboxypeptidase (penicillin-binding protein 5/6)